MKTSNREYEKFGQGILSNIGNIKGRHRFNVVFGVMFLALATIELTWGDQQFSSSRWRGIIAFLGINPDSVNQALVYATIGIIFLACALFNRRD